MGISLLVISSSQLKAHKINNEFQLVMLCVLRHLEVKGTIICLQVLNVLKSNELIDM